MDDMAKALRIGFPTPSGPARSRFLGNLPEMRRDPLGLMLRTAREYGAVSSLTLVETVYMLNAPEDVKHVLQANYVNYAKARQTVRIKPIVGDGLLTSDGDFWRRQRKLAQPAFHRTRLTAFADTMAAATETMLAEWDRLPDGHVIDLAAAMSRLTLRVIGLTMFGRDLDGEAPAVSRALDTALAITNDRFRRLLFLPWLPTPSNVRFALAMRTLDKLVASIIAERRRGSCGNDLLSMFMEARDDETGEGMTDKQLRDEVMTMLLAGHETTSNALAWTFVLLDRHRDVAEAVLEESRIALGDRAPSFEDLRKLPLARRVIQEAMRLYPPVWLFARTAKQDDLLPSGTRVPAGTMVFVCPYTLHRDPVIWPDPDRFDPGRFTEAVAAGRHKMAYVPFAAGPRQCIGNEFALMEATIILSMILRRREVLIENPSAVQPEPSVTLRPKGGLTASLCTY